jgi:hypothetical protein
MNIAQRIALAAVAACLPAFAAEEEVLDTTPALEGATRWLALVDQHRYGESWEQASAFFKGAIARAQWESSVQAARGPLGAVDARKLLAANYSRVLPGSPPGEYVVIRFGTAFVNRPLASEIVTQSREKDGTWRVSGYFIQ